MRAYPGPLLAVLILLALAGCRTRPAEPARSPLRSGETDLHLVYDPEASEAQLEAAARVLTQRLGDFGVDGASAEARGTQLRVTVPHIAQDEHARVTSIVQAPGRLELAAVEEHPTWVERFVQEAMELLRGHTPVGAAVEPLRTEPETYSYFLHSGDRGLLERTMRAVVRSAEDGPHRFAVARGETRWRTYALEPLGAVVFSDVVFAEIRESLEAGGPPHVEVILGEQGRAQLHEFTKRLIDRRIAIIFDGEILAVPRVGDAIANGQTMIFAPDGLAPAETRRVVETIASSLRSGPLPVALTR